MTSDNPINRPSSKGILDYIDDKCQLAKQNETVALPNLNFDQLKQILKNLSETKHIEKAERLLNIIENADNVLIQKSSNLTKPKGKKGQNKKSEVSGSSSKTLCDSGTEGADVIESNKASSSSAMSRKAKNKKGKN
jgi:hypothetical protein